MTTPPPEDLGPEVLEELERLLERATPGDWHHVQPFQTVPAQRTVHGPTPARRVDYVSTWPGKGTPPGHRVVIGMTDPDHGPGVRSDDMALIAAMKARLPSLISAAKERDRLRALLALSPADRHQLATLPDFEFVISRDDWDVQPFVAAGWVSQVGERTYNRRPCRIYQITEEGKLARAALSTPQKEED